MRREPEGGQPVGRGDLNHRPIGRCRGRNEQVGKLQIYFCDTFGDFPTLGGQLDPVGLADDQLAQPVFECHQTAGQGGLGDPECLRGAQQATCTGNRQKAAHFIPEARAGDVSPFKQVVVEQLVGAVDWPFRIVAHPRPLKSYFAKVYSTGNSKLLGGCVVQKKTTSAR